MVLTTFSSGREIGAQSVAAPLPGRADTLPPGTFRGTLVVRAIATSHEKVDEQPVSGTAHWRLELDSLDWRRKLTIRIALLGPEAGVYIIRTSSAGAPNALLRARNVATSHIDPRFYTATLTVREKSEERVYSEWSGRDSLTFTVVEPLSATAVLGGTLRFQGYHDVDPRTPGARAGQLSTRILAGAFAATFDPRPELLPSTMTTELQTKIIQRALYDFALNWMNNRVSRSVGDSTADNDKARAFLTNRWGEAAIMDSVAVGDKTMFVRMRGKLVPVTCTVRHDDNAPRCTGTGARH